MKKSKLIKYAWNEVMRCKSRSVSNVITYSLAVLLLSSVGGLIFNSEEKVNSILSNTGTHFISFKPKCCGLPYITGKDQNFIANGIPSQPMPTSLIKTIKKIPEVLDASPFILYKAKNEGTGIPFTIGGFDINNPIAVSNTSCAPGDVLDGHFLISKDTTAVMLEESFASANGLTVNQQFLINSGKFKIAGIINPGIRPAKADVYMNINTAEKIIGEELGSPVKDIMNIVLVESANAFVHKKAIDKVNKIMGTSNLISSYGCYKPARVAMDINRTSLKIIFVSIFLFVLCFAFNNQQSSVSERKRDFAILSAIGWPSERILNMILYECLFQIVISSLISSGIYTVLLIAPGNLFTTDLNISISIIASGIILVMAAVFIASIIPAWLKIRTAPSPVLRSVR